MRDSVPSTFEEQLSDDHLSSGKPLIAKGTGDGLRFATGLGWPTVTPLDRSHVSREELVRSINFHY